MLLTFMENIDKTGYLLKISH